MNSKTILVLALAAIFLFSAVSASRENIIEQFARSKSIVRALGKENVQRLLRSDLTVQEDALECPSLSCNYKLDDACTFDCQPNGNYTECKQCDFSFYCDQDTEKCTARVEPGEDCETSDQCLPYAGNLVFGDRHCDTQTDTCSDYPDYRIAGEKCDADDFPCEYDLDCVSGVCKAAEEGDECWSSYGNCAMGLFCNMTGGQNGTCTPVKSLGQSCDNAYECSYDAQCSNGTCVALYSRAAGESCSSNQDCQLGLACNSTTSMCESVTLYSSCSTSADCPANQACLCPFAAESPEPICANPNIYPNTTLAHASIKVFTQCAQDNGCFGSYCFDTHCGEEYMCFFRAIYDEIYGYAFDNCAEGVFPTEEQCIALASSSSSASTSTGGSTSGSHTDSNGASQVSIASFQFLALIAAVFAFFF